MIMQNYSIFTEKLKTHGHFYRSPFAVNVVLNVANGWTVVHGLIKLCLLSSPTCILEHN